MLSSRRALLLRGSTAAQGLAGRRPAAALLHRGAPSLHPPHGAGRMAAHGASSAAERPKPVLLFDIMDTVVYDPFFNDMPAFFNMSFKELLASKHPSTWIEFECGHITEDELAAKFFADGRAFDGPALRRMMRESYRYLDGMEDLLARLNTAGYELHALSNYPSWWRIIEDKLQPSRYLRWTFISCEGPMKGLRKPAREAYDTCVVTLGVPPSQLIFVDDRKVNVDAALAGGLDAIVFKGAAPLEEELVARGLIF